MSTTMRKAVSLLMLAAMIVTLVPFAFGEEVYAAKIKLSKTNLIIGVGQTAKLTVKGTKKKVKWSSTDKSIATVTKKGVVKAKQIGYCRIKAKVGKKTLKCAVKVKTVEEANARNLRNYIIKNGKKAKDGGFYLRKKWSGMGDTDESYAFYTATVKAYSNKEDMYFEYLDDHDQDGYRVKCTMTINLICQKPGEIYTTYTEPESGYENAYGEIGYDFSYDSGKDPSTTGITLSKYESYDQYEDVTKTVTDPAELGKIAGNSGARMSYAFSDFDRLFKAYKLKSRMKNLGFSNL